MHQSGANPKCPHCGEETRKWEVPEGGTWDVPFLYVCFNDDCKYFIEGWDWMQMQYAQNSSYRYSQNPRTGKSAPLPVWSSQALKNKILDAE